MRKVAVVGVGMTKFGSLAKTNVELFSEAAMDALHDAGLKARDVQALFVANCLGEFAEGQINLAPFIAANIGAAGIPATRFEGACASATVTIRDAFMWVASGYYDIVLAGGTEKAGGLGTPFATRTFQMGSDSRYESPTGITFPGIFAMMAHLYASKYRIPLAKLKEQMAMVAIKNHRNGALNPKAHFQKEITMEDVKKSIMVAQPLQLYDCCPFSDGAAAVVLASEDLAKKLADKPVYIVGVGQASAGPLPTQKDITRVKARELSVKQAYAMAGLTPKDIDVCELHDCFTIAEIVASESLGFFDFGDGGNAAERGDTKVGGKIPINPSGGLKAKGHPIGATGAAQVYEIVKQLRGGADRRQVDGAKTGLVDTLGGDLMTVSNLILRRS